MQEKRPEDYMKEMMELYKRSHPEPKPVPRPEPEPMPRPEPKPMPMPEPQPMPMPEPEPMPRPEPQPMPRPEPEPMPRPEPQPMPRPEPEPMPRPEPQPMPRPEPQPMPMPEPQPMPRPEPIPMPMPEAPEIILPEDTLPPETSFGWLQVTARSADSALPVEGASVMVLKRNGTENILVQTLLTDESGKTPKIQLPAPAVTTNPMQPFSVYTVKIHRPGYIRLESRDVPIFPGVTSVQPFAMIPLPKGEGEDTPAVVNENTEPEF